MNAALSLYNLLSLAAAGLCLPAAALSARRRPYLAARLGLDRPDLPPGGLWVHALSLGEVTSTRPLLAELHRAWPELALNLSATTASGLAQAQAEAKAGRAQATLTLPYDLAWSVGRVLEQLRPAGLVIVETDIWPNLLRLCRARGVPTALVNFRVSERRRRFEGRLKGLFSQVYGLLDLICCQTEADQTRLRSLGPPPGTRIEVTGSLKYDQPDPVPARPEEVGLVPGRPAVVAGSTHEGEEEAILAAWAELRRDWPDLALILAPRNPERFEPVARLIQANGPEPARLSRGEPVTLSRPILLVDQLGRLAGLYALGRAAFVGGSLVPKGGHNLLEPAALARPVAFGPHVTNFRAEAERLLAAGGGLQAASAGELTQAWRSWLADPAAAEAAGRAARRVFTANQGAAARTVALLAEAWAW